MTRLDGVPLAIELAAPRLATMSPAAVAARLDRSFELLAPGPAGAPARHRTLRATVDWSFQLLGADARRLFAALSVFRRGWTLDTAERVAPAVGLDEASTAPLMADLVEQSMVRIELPTEGTARYDMLAAIRDYVADYLSEIGASGAVADRHAAYFLELAEQAVPHRRGPREPAWVRGLEVEFANLRAAYEWLVASGQLGDALRLVSALVDDVLMRERLEIGRWAEELVALDAIAPEPLRGVAQALAGNTAMVEGRLDDARRLSADALAAPGPEPCWIAHNTLGLLAAAEGDEAGWSGHMAAMEAASRASGDPMAAAVADFDRALIASLRGRRADAAGPARALLSLAADQANPSLRAMALLSQARTFGPGDDQRAGAVLREALVAARSTHNTLLTQQALRAIGELNARGGDRPAALEALRGVTRRFGESGNVAEQHQTIISMLDPLVAMGEFTAAATICGALSSTPWHNTFTYRTIDKTVGDRLDRDRHLAARRAGQAMSPADLVLYTSRLVRELRLTPPDDDRLDALRRAGDPEADRLAAQLRDRPRAARRPRARTPRARPAAAAGQPGLGAGPRLAVRRPAAARLVRRRPGAGRAGLLRRLGAADLHDAVLLVAAPGLRRGRRGAGAGPHVRPGLRRPAAPDRRDRPDAPRRHGPGRGAARRAAPRRPGLPDGAGRPAAPRVVRSCCWRAAPSPAPATSRCPPAGATTGGSRSTRKTCSGRCSRSPSARSEGSTGWASPTTRRRPRTTCTPGASSARCSASSPTCCRSTGPRPRTSPTASPRATTATAPRASG